jgi:hypothetical protein
MAENCKSPRTSLDYETVKTGALIRGPRETSPKPIQMGEKGVEKGGVQPGSETSASAVIRTTDILLTVGA